MLLNDEDKRMMGGERGAGTARAIELLVKMGETHDAEKLVRTAYAHISYDFSPEGFWDLMTEGVPKTPNRVTTHPSFSPEEWEEWGLPLAKNWKVEHDRKLKRFLELGWLRTETCAEYLIGIVPHKGDIVSMGGSCMQVTNNSLFGARVDRMGICFSLAAAICGRTPLMGLLLPDNRFANHLADAGDLDISDWGIAHFHCLGYFIGDQIPGFKPVAITGIPPNLPFDYARALVVSMPTSGAVTLAHVVGTTPEAPTLEAALGNKKPEHVIRVSKKDMARTWERLNVWDHDLVEHVALGCPHATIDEIGKVATLLEGKRIKTSLLIGASKPVEALARRQGYADIIESAGGHFSCVCPSITNPFTRSDIAGSKQAKNAATNSARSAHYLAYVSGVKVFFGTDEECINAAITGKWKGDIPKWK
jgi:predicted aconitase